MIITSSKSVQILWYHSKLGHISNLDPCSLVQLDLLCCSPHHTPPPHLIGKPLLLIYVASLRSSLISLFLFFFCLPGLVSLWIGTTTHPGNLPQFWVICWEDYWLVTCFIGFFPIVKMEAIFWVLVDEIHARDSMTTRN